MLGRRQQRLRRNAADVDAGAAQRLVHLDADGERPSCAARIAATYPPGPPPMTTTSAGVSAELEGAEDEVLVAEVPMTD